METRKDVDFQKSQVDLRDQVLKWREERQARLVARVLHKRRSNVSSAVFGTVSKSAVQIATNDMSLTSSAAPVKSKSAKNFKKGPKQAPEIKHTIASRLRMIKTNPLLELRGLITAPTVSKISEGSSRNTNKNVDILDKVPSVSTRHISMHQRAKSTSSIQKEVSSCRKPVINDSARKDSSIKQSLRFSTSVHKIPNESRKNIRRVKSFADIQDLTIPIIEEEEEDGNDEDTFLPLPFTPNNWQTPRRTRSVLLSESVQKEKLASPSPSVFTPTPAVMRKRLSDWLQKRGKSLQSYHHLHCFGLHAHNVSPVERHSTQKFAPKSVNSKSQNQKKINTSSTSNTEILEMMPNIPHSVSYKEKIPEENKENECRNQNLIAEDALADLQKIINLGYPWEQCEEWLLMIRKSCANINEKPLYWECLAALEEARGDFKSAVDCYERAIIRGASPTQVGDSLDQLMEKFNLLNLNCDLENDKSSNVRTPRKRILDARNIFKSSIIKFALQQKALKSLSTDLGVEATSLHYVVTPVRRSTRSSRSHYMSTPGVLCVKSLNQLEPNVRKSMIFHPNSALE